ncbi:T9SS type A sorting domain-containing protein [Calditrichota bacterium LG25]
MMRFLVLTLFVLSNILLAKTTVISHSPQSVSVVPTNEGARISWELNLPDTVLSFNNSVPYGIWSPHLNQALGCVFDLSAFPNATLEQIDFVHYSRQKMHGPYYYRILFFDMDSSKLFYTIDSLQAGDSFDYPRFEVGVPLGSIPARDRVGIFVEGLSSPDGSNAFPALMTDSSEYVPGISYYLADVNDPFLASNPDYTNFYELSEVANGATNLLLDLWINTGGNKTSGANLRVQPVLARPNSFSDDGLVGFLEPSVAKAMQITQNQSIIDGFYIYRGDTTNGLFEQIAEVTAEVRQYIDTNPLSDSSYFYAVSSFNELTTSIKKISAYFQPPVLVINEARVDNDNDFSPDLSGKIVAVRGTVVSPNFSDKVQYFINDKEGGILLYSSRFSLDLKIGDSLFVYGKITQYKGLTEIALDSAAQVQVIGQKEHPPMPLTLADVGEAYEGQLVSFSGLRLVNPADWPAEGNNGASVMVTDGQDTVALFIDKDTDLDGWTPPVGTFSMIAIVDQYTNNTPASDGYELRPRSRDDFAPETAIETPLPAVKQFDLKPCYPNPFNPITTIEFTLPHQARVSIKIFNIRGQLIETALEQVKEAGRHTLKFNGVDLPSGIYLVSFKAGDFQETQKIILIK